MYERQAHALYQVYNNLKHVGGAGTSAVKGRIKVQTPKSWRMLFTEQAGFFHGS